MSKRNRIKNQGNRKPSNNPKYTLSSYDPVMIEIPSITIQEDQVEEQMQLTAEKFPEYIPVEDRAILPTDHLLVTMKTFDGQIPLNNLTKEKKRISLSDEYLPEGLKTQLLDMRVNDTKTISFDAPGPQIDKSDEPVFIPVTSTITIHEIQEETCPEITDAWVSTFIPGADTVEAFRNRVRRQMEGKANSYIEDIKYSQCAAVLASRLESRIPDELFERGIESAKKEFEDMLKQNNATKELYLARQGMSEEELTYQFMARGRQMISEGMALEAMADHLDLTVTDEDINAVFSGATPQQAENMRKSYEQAGKSDELKRMAYCGKALEYVVANAKITQKTLTGSMNPLDNLPGV